MWIFNNIKVCRLFKASEVYGHFWILSELYEKFSHSQEKNVTPIN